MRSIEKLKSQKFVKGLSVAAIFIATTLLYQNCAPPPATPPEGGYTKNSTSSGGAADDFAYDLTLDTFAYMSCAHENLKVTSATNISYQRESLFTFKVGAYQSGSGLRLTPAYYDDTKHYTQDRFEEKLKQDGLNAPATLQMSMRMRSDLSQHYVNSEKHVSYLLSRSLGHRAIAGELRKQPQGSRLNFFQKLNGYYARHLHGQLYGVHRSSQTRRSIMSVFQNSAMVVVSYVDPTSGDLSSAPIIKVDSNGEKFLGVGFHLQERGKKLDAITEVNLTTMQNGRSWACNNSMKFMIVSHNDYLKSLDDNGNSTICPMKTDYEQIKSNPSIKTSLERVRAILDPSKSLWAINMQASTKCIVEKAPLNCYSQKSQSGTGDDANAIYVEYKDPTKCSELDDNCPHYLTVCTRQ